MDEESTEAGDDVDFAELDEITEDVPWTPQRVGHLLYRCVSNYDNPDVLEIACGYGKTTPYLAKAAKSRGGVVRACDYERRTWEGKSAANRIEEAGLSDVCEFCFGQDARWYTLDLVREQPGEWIDFVYLDLSHTIEVDAFVALAVWTHLSPGGIIVFDDLDFTVQGHGSENSRTNRPEVHQMQTLFDYIGSLPDVEIQTTWGGDEMYWRWGFIQKKQESQSNGPLVSDVLEEF